jgi:hypothetical protein
MVKDPNVQLGDVVLEETIEQMKALGRTNIGCCFIT